MAIFLVLFAFACGAAKTGIVRHIGDDISLQLIIFAQFSLSALFTLPRIIASKGELLKVKNPPQVLARAVYGVAYWYSMFIAIDHLSLFDTSVLSNLAPIWVLVIAHFCLGRTFDKKLYIVAVVGFLGSVFVLKPTSGILNIGAIWGVASGIFLALTIISVKLLVHTERSDTINFYYYIIASLMMAPFVPRDLTSISQETIMLLILNAFFMVIHQYSMNKGLEIGNEAQLSILAYTSILFSLIIGFAIWKEVPDNSSIFGASIIVLSGIYASNSKSAKNELH